MKLNMLCGSCQFFKLILELLRDANYHIQFPQNFLFVLVRYYALPRHLAGLDVCAGNMQPPNQKIDLTASASQQIELCTKLFVLGCLFEVNGIKVRDLNGAIAPLDRVPNDSCARPRRVNGMHKCSSDDFARCFLFSLFIFQLEVALKGWHQNRHAQTDQCENCLSPVRPLRWSQARPSRPEYPTNFRMHPNFLDRSPLEPGHCP